MKRIALLLPLLLLGCKNQPTVSASDVALSISSVPAQVCIQINQARPELLRQAGESMFALAAEEGWPLERRREAIIRLHQRDDTLRALVSPSFVEGSEARTGSCRRITEQLERLSVNIESWEEMEAFDFREVVSDALQIMDDLLVTLSAMGVPDFYRVLDDLHQIGGVGLGEHLRSFIDIGNRLLSGGVEGLMRGADNE